MSSELRERLSLFLSAGGKKATLLWFINRFLGLEIYGFYAYSLEKIKQPPDASYNSLQQGFQFVAITSIGELEKLPKSLVIEFNKQSGDSIEKLLGKGGYFFALIDELTPVVQLNIYCKFPITVDTPIKMNISYDQESCFLAFLYTHDVFRRKGYATNLISLVMRELKDRKIKNMVTHIRLSNIRSTHAFLNNGWDKISTLCTKGKDSILLKTGTKRLVLSLEQPKVVKRI